jgi:hypothetical protein
MEPISDYCELWSAVRTVMQLVQIQFISFIRVFAVCRYNGKEYIVERKQPRKLLESSGPGTGLWQAQSGAGPTSTAGRRQDADTDGQ